MKGAALPIAALVGILGALPSDAAGDPESRLRRLSVAINRHWTFRYLPSPEASVGYERPDVDDSTWRPIALPHTWSTYETTGELHPYIRSPSERDDPHWWVGWGWYRKHFVLDRELAGRKVFLEFDGVQKYCKVWLNGAEVGDHKGGFASFSFDVTDHVRFGEDNLLAVAVNNARVDRFRTPPMAAGNWNVYGGIHRDVRLVVKDRLHIPFQGSARHEGGTFVTTPAVSRSEGTVRVRTWVRNDHPEPRDATLVTTIVDAEGRAVVEMRTAARIASRELRELDQLSPPIARPRLWSPTDPYLYRVRSEVYEGPRLADHAESPLGFRWFRWDGEENRLYLNGERIHIHGTNRHEEYPWLGAAMPKWMHEMDLADIRFHLNHNFLRTAHYTQDPLVYDFCDRTGILVAEEVPNIKDQDFSEEVQREQLVEMIRRDRNHPSILFWSMGNETNDAADSAWAMAEDGSRILHARHVSGKSAGAHVTHTHENMEMEQLLKCTVRGWTDDHVKSIRGGAQVTGNEELQHAMALADPGLTAGNGVMWLYADHGADREYAYCPLLHVNPKGWVDSYRVPKYVYYLWQANHALEPMVFVHPHFWRAAYLGQKKDLLVDSNCDAVELKVNGVSQGVLRPSRENRFTVTFRGILVERGTLSVEGRKGDRTASHTVAMAGPAARVVLTARPAEFEAARDSVAIVMADIVDADGVHVYGATNPLTWEVSGPATLVGPRLYESDIDENGASEGTFYIDAPVANVIRSTGKMGRIRVEVSAPGLAPGDVSIEAVAPRATGVAGVIEPPLPEVARRRAEDP